jgi:hypothetical protein
LLVFVKIDLCAANSDPKDNGGEIPAPGLTARAGVTFLSRYDLRIMPSIGEEICKIKKSKLWG